MAYTEHPLTGEPLNVISVKNKSLTRRQAVTAHVLRLQGDTFTDIVQKLGTNANRVGEVFNGTRHSGAAFDAIKIVSKSGLRRQQR